MAHAWKALHIMLREVQEHYRLGFIFLFLHKGCKVSFVALETQESKTCVCATLPGFPQPLLFQSLHVKCEMSQLLELVSAMGHGWFPTG